MRARFCGDLRLTLYSPRACNGNSIFADRLHAVRFDQGGRRQQGGAEEPQPRHVPAVARGGHAAGGGVRSSSIKESGHDARGKRCGQDCHNCQRVRCFASCVVCMRACLTIHICLGLLMQLTRSYAASRAAEADIFKLTLEDLSATEVFDDWQASCWTRFHACKWVQTFQIGSYGCWSTPSAPTIARPSS